MVMSNLNVLEVTFKIMMKYLPILHRWCTGSKEQRDKRVFPHHCIIVQVELHGCAAFPVETQTCILNLFLSLKC